MKKSLVQAAEIIGEWWWVEKTGWCRADEQQDVAARGKRQRNEKALRDHHHHHQVRRREKWRMVGLRWRMPKKCGAGWGWMNLSDLWFCCWSPLPENLKFSFLLPRRIYRDYFSSFFFFNYSLLLVHVSVVLPCLCREENYQPEVSCLEASVAKWPPLEEDVDSPLLKKVLFFFH